MRPKRIIFIRHGESIANKDRAVYGEVPDYRLDLTETGREQSYQAGQALKKILGDEKVQVYLSPYYRTRQTFAEIKKSIADNVVEAREDPRIREQDWGHLREVDDNKEIDRERDQYSTFYFRIPDGESGADVYDRVSVFMDTLHRDFEENDFPGNVLVVTHGMTMRLFLMRWFHWTVEEFQTLRNPKNCQIVILEKQDDGHYNLVSDLTRRT